MEAQLTHHSCKSKVTNFDHFFGCNEKIFRFDVSVNTEMEVAVGQA
jgi:hypothetical protein